MAHTKIVATVGPATSAPAMIARLVAAGVDVFRLNMSHGDHAGHARVIAAIRDVSARAARPLGILCDLSGPKIRVGAMEGGGVELLPGARLVLCAEPGHGSATRVSVSHANLAADVRPGARLLLDDGLLELRVLAVEGGDVVTSVVRGGILRTHKGVNAPDSHLSVSSMTDKDRADMAFALEQDVDMFAVSFVRNAEDVQVFRRHMASLGGGLPIISKVEMSEAVDNLEQIVAVSDGAMVARGDLGVEIPIERVPLVQKELIALCNRLGKPVITATQMLDSMMRSPSPTRAEATDVANAILDGTDALMLSGETAVGAYPVESVETMNRIAAAAETALERDTPSALRRKPQAADSVPDAISRATVLIAHDLGLRSILCLTRSGGTARMVARYRPAARVLAYTPVPRTARQLCLSWGVVSVVHDGPDCVDAECFDGLVRAATGIFRADGTFEPGERVVVTGGLPMGAAGRTNLLRVIDVP